MISREDHGRPQTGSGTAQADQVELPGVVRLSALPASVPVLPARAAGSAHLTDQPGSPAGVQGSWTREFGATNVGSTPYAVAVNGDVVYVGGDFAGPMAGMPEGTYNRIARWDGVGWQQLGTGVDGTVRAIAVVGDSVYVGGEFSVAGKVAASRLARWDGTTWTGVGGGVTSTTQPQLGSVRALASDGTRLYVAGVFDQVGAGGTALAASGFAAFSLQDGTWEAFGEGLRFLDGPGEGRALAVGGGRVYVGGYFDHAGPAETGSFASLDPAAATWVGYGGGIRNGEFVGSVDCLALDQEMVYIGGSFTAADAVATSGIATLSGDRFGSLGTFTRFGDASTAGVSALAFAAGSLYAGGEFTAAGNAAATSWAVYDGTEWSTPGAGVDNVVRALAAYRSGVVVAGDFTFSGPLRVPAAGIWTGTQWQSFGHGLSYDPYADANVFAVVAVESRVFAGGYFDQAGAVPVGSIAEWTGQEWHPMAGGVKGANGLGTIYAMVQLGDDLFVTGSFASAGDGSAANIARWDGRGWSALGSGINDTGYALAVLGGRLYVGGRFRAAGGTAANGVAVWDPATSAWSTLGNAPGYDDSVLGLAVIADRYLVIGGQYNVLRQGGVDLVRGLNGMTIYDTASAVDPVDPLSGYLLLAGVQRSRGTGTVRALKVVGEDLYLGGNFDTAGVLLLTSPEQLGFAASNLAVWHFGTDGDWTTPGGTDEPVMALAADDATVIVGGWFGTAGPIAASGVVRYAPETQTWTAYGSGIGRGERGVRHVEAVQPDREGGLWIGGTFNTAGDTPSCSFGHWQPAQ